MAAAAAVAVATAAAAAAVAVAVAVAEAAAWIAVTPTDLIRFRPSYLNFLDCSFTIAYKLYLEI